MADNRPVGDLNYRYEDIFQRMVPVQWRSDTPTKRRSYSLKGALPFQLYFRDGTLQAKTRKERAEFIHCCGSTISCIYMEMERKCMAVSAPPRTFRALWRLKGDERKKCPPFLAYKVWMPYKLSDPPKGGLTGRRQRDGVKAGIELFGIGFGLEHQENFRRGDGAQIWWNGWWNTTKVEKKKRLSGHNIFIWDVCVTGEGEARFQQLSAQPNTGGVGVSRDPLGAKRARFDPTDHAYCLELLDHKPTWRRVKEIHGARFYRFFPYWPIHLGDVPTDRSGFGQDAQGNPLGQGGLLVGGPAATVATDVEKYYENNEGHGTGNPKRSGGFFPIGSNRTWHGGVHLYPKKAFAPVYAASDGVIIAARCPTRDKMLEGAVLRTDSDDQRVFPSRCFVLVRHQVKIDGVERVFYCLYMHLDNTRTGSTLMESRWLWRLRNDKESDPVKQRLEAGRVVHLAEPVAAGDIVGHVAAAATGGMPKLHVEIFSDGEQPPIVTFPRGKQIEDDNHDLFIDNISKSEELYDILTSEMTTDFFGWDSVITADEVCTFFHKNHRRDELRRYVCKHISEWSDDKIEWDRVREQKRWDWAGEEERVKLATAIRVYGWWTDKLSEHGGEAGLPKSQVVWTYHPITFLTWLQDKVRDDPRGKQIEQDVKSFLRGAASGRTDSDSDSDTEAEDEPAQDGLWRITHVKRDTRKCELGLFTDGDPKKPYEGLTVRNYFKASDAKDSKISKFRRFSAWITVGKNGDNSAVKQAPDGGPGDGKVWLTKDAGRVCFEDTGSAPGEIIQRKPNDPFDSKECAYVRGAVVQVGDIVAKARNGKTYDFIKFDAWVCVGTKARPERYAEPV